MNNSNEINPFSAAMVNTLLCLFGSIVVFIALLFGTVDMVIDKYHNVIESSKGCGDR